MPFEYLDMKKSDVAFSKDNKLDETSPKFNLESLIQDKAYLSEFE